MAEDDHNRRCDCNYALTILVLLRILTAVFKLRRVASDVFCDPTSFMQYEATQESFGEDSASTSRLVICFGDANEARRTLRHTC